MSLDYELRQVTEALNNLVKAIEPFLYDHNYSATIDEFSNLEECVVDARETLAIWAYIRDLEEDLQSNGPLQ